MIRTYQLLTSLLWRPSALTPLLSAPEAKLNNLKSINISYQPLIQEATQPLKKEPSFNGVPVSSTCIRRSLLPFQGDTFSLLTGTATTKDVKGIKTRINQLITSHHNQQQALAHVISILNIIRYATNVNRQHINIIMNSAEKMHQDVTELYSTTHSLYSSLSYQQIILHTQSILANLWDSLYYMREVALHTMDCIDASTRGILVPHVLHVKDLREILSHIVEMPPSTIHLPISPEEAPHFYGYLCTHVLIADEQSSFLINVPVQDDAQQMEIYEVFNMDIPYGNFSAHYDIQNKYLGIMHDETNMVEYQKINSKHNRRPTDNFAI